MRRWFVLPAVILVTLVGSRALWGVQDQAPAAAGGGASKKVDELRRARVAIARAGVERLELLRAQGKDGDAVKSLQDRSEWEELLYIAESEAAAAVDDLKAEVAAAARYLEACRKLQAEGQQLEKVGRIELIERLRLDYDVADAECLLAELQAEEGL